MTKFSFYFLILLLFAAMNPISTQSLEEDNNVLFLKANILYQTSRYDEAIRLYNRILNDQPTFSGALLMRGKSKFALGAFKGTKKDILGYIDQRGISDEIIEIMAETELKLENLANALSYFEILLHLKPFEGKYFAKAGDLALENGNRNKACQYWIKGAKLGDASAAKQASLRCAYDHTIHLPPKRSEETASQDDVLLNDEVMSEDGKFEEADKTGEVGETGEVSEREETGRTAHVDMNVIQEIKIDKELTLKITAGLGERKIEDYPNILMLSDKSGIVAIDICVNSEGKVFRAEISTAQTTIFRTSLSSLAIRKAKELVFIPSLSEEQCGVLIYDIDTSR